MKTIMTGVVCLGIGMIAGIIISRNLREEPPLSPPPMETAASPAKERAQQPVIIPAGPEPARVAGEKTNEATPVAVAAAPQPEPESPKAAALRRAVQTLVSSQASLQEKQAVMKQLRESGQLDDALTALRKGAAENPNSSAYPTAIGQVDLQKAYVLSQNGGTVNQMAVLGMDADQNFDTALKLDPTSWEAQFSKAAAMSYWPAELNKGPEVTQRLMNLIDQQETMPSQPQFAQTYVLLGDQYQKAGQMDYASQTWQLGAQRFPADPTLRARIAGTQNQ